MTIPMKYYQVADDRMFIFDELTFQDQSCAQCIHAPSIAKAIKSVLYMFTSSRTSFLNTLKVLTLGSNKFLLISSCKHRNTHLTVNSHGYECIRRCHVLITIFKAVGIFIRLQKCPYRQRQLDLLEMPLSLEAAGSRGVSKIRGNTVNFKTFSNEIE